MRCSRLRVESSRSKRSHCSSVSCRFDINHNCDTELQQCSGSRRKSPDCHACFDVSRRLTAAGARKLRRSGARRRQRRAQCERHSSCASCRVAQCRADRRLGLVTGEALAPSLPDTSQCAECAACENIDGSSARAAARSTFAALRIVAGGIRGRLNRSQTSYVLRIPPRSLHSSLQRPSTCKPSLHENLPNEREALVLPALMLM